MKKLIAMLLVLAMVLSFAGCAKKDLSLIHISEPTRPY